MTKLVLIIGAGPVGMTMASELARYGVALRIIDKAAQRTDKSKALVLWSRTLELLDRGGGSSPFVDAGFKAEAVNFIAGDKVIGRVALDSVQSPYPYGLMLPQSETERLLEERLGTFGSRSSAGSSSPHSRAATTASRRYCDMPTDARRPYSRTGWWDATGRTARRDTRSARHLAARRWTVTGCWPMSTCEGIRAPTTRHRFTGIGTALLSSFRSPRVDIGFWRTCLPQAPSIRRHQRWSRFKR